MKMLLHAGLAVALSLATSLAAAATGGARPESGPLLDVRWRFEQVDDAGFARHGNANTLRVRAGWRWVFAPGWQAVVEGSHTQPIGPARYNDSANGKTQYPLVLDPRTTSLTQAFVGYDQGAWLARVGRQRLEFDNQRFIGPVGWRQNEQTFDAIALRHRIDAGWALDYAWLDRVWRVPGHDHPDPRQSDWRLDGHLLHLGRPLQHGNLAAYAWLIDNRDLALHSSRTFGARWVDARQAGDWRLGWTLEAARQLPWHNADLRGRHNYRRIEGRAGWRRLEFQLGQEVLGGDGRSAFTTPYATLHAFNGWADRFGATPPDGLDDRWAGLQGPLGRATWLVRWHDFRAGRGGRSYGNELDASLAVPLGRGFSGLLKAADYRADGFGQDVRKLWAMLEYRY